MRRIWPSAKSDASSLLAHMARVCPIGAEDAERERLIVIIWYGLFTIAPGAVHLSASTLCHRELICRVDHLIAGKGIRCAGATFAPYPAMSAIIIHAATASRPTETSPLLSHPDSSPSSSGIRINKPARSGSTTTKHIPRVAPLRDSLSTARFVAVCVGIWSANFIFAVQSTAIPTLAPEVSSWFGHAELAAYMGSIFSLSSAAGECPGTRTQVGCARADRSHPDLWGVDGLAGQGIRDGRSVFLFRLRSSVLRAEHQHLVAHRRAGFRRGEFRRSAVIA